MTDPEARLLPLEGIHNFRDYGGYAVIGGGRLRRGVLWRSGQHCEATDADLARVDALGLVAVFDLRSHRERASHPCRRPSGFDAVVHLVDESAPGFAVPGRDGTAPAAPHVSAARAAAARPQGRRDAAFTHEGFVRSYAGFPYRPAQVVAMRQMFATLASADGPSLVNCMAGKDRTGFAVAMVQRALGVHRDDVIADYLLTGQLGDQEARIAAGYRSFGAATGDLEPEVVRAIMGVEPEYIASALAAIDAEHGEERYLAEVLGADAGLRERLRARLVEG